MDQETIHEKLLSAALENRAKTAFHFFRGGWLSLTYGEFHDMAVGLSADLLEMGMTKGGRAAIVAENRPEWPASYLGVLMAGGVAVPVDARLTKEETRNILSHSGAAIAIVTDETMARVEEAAEGLGVSLFNLDNLSSPKAPPTARPQAVGLEEGDVASLIYTSGTTGAPKAVMLTHGNILSDAWAVLGAGIITGRDNVVSVLPLHHTYPFMCTFVVPVLAGASVTYPAGLKGPEIAEASVRTGATILAGVPQMLELMHKRIMERLSGAPFSGPVLLLVRALGALRRRLDINIMGRIFKPLGGRFRFLACGGARLEPGVMSGLEALGFTVLEGYGLTETSPIVAFNPPGKRKPGSVGRPLSPAEIKILSPSPEGEGEVAIRGPMVMEGYYKSPRDTASSFAEGWLKSGDLGRMDRDGYLYITGRLKEVIVLASGKNIYPEEVEKHYAAGCPLVREMCVFEETGMLKAVVVPDVERAKAEGVGNIRDAIRWKIEGLSGRLPPHMRIRGIELRIGPLPRTPLGKLKRYMVRAEEKKTHEGGGDDPALASDDVGRAVLVRLRTLLPEAPAAIRGGDHLELDLGLDSLMKLELAASLEKSLSVDLPAEAVASAHTVMELVTMIKESRERGGPSKGPGEGMAAVLLGEPTPEEANTAGLSVGRSMRAVGFLLALVLKGLMRVLFGLRAKGLENIPEGPCIIAANHASYLDGFALGASLPLRGLGRAYFLGVKQYFSGRATSFFGRLAHVIPIDPDAQLEAALRLSGHVLRKGAMLFIFPEGGRTFDGEIMGFKKGVAMLALDLGVPVVPARIEGTWAILPRGAALPRPGRIRITFGRPIAPVRPPEAETPKADEDAYQRFADGLRKTVSETSFGDH